MIGISDLNVMFKGPGSISLNYDFNYKIVSLVIMRLAIDIAHLKKWKK